MNTPLQPPLDGILRVVDLAQVAAGGVAEPAPDILLRCDGQGLIYRGAINTLLGEPGAGKSFIALAAAVEVVSAGGFALWLDFEDNEGTMAGRSLALGFQEAMFDRLVYAQVTGRLERPHWAFLAELAKTGLVDLIVVDSVAESMAVQGLDENDAGDVTRWGAQLRPLARAGAAVLLVDHVTKSEEGRGRWARGSGAKLAFIDGAAYSLEVVASFSRSQSGHGTLRVAKDRHGQVGAIDQVAAEVRFEVESGSIRRVALSAPEDGPVARPVTKPKRVSAEDVAQCLQASGGYWASQAEAAKALGVSTNAVAAILKDALGAGLVEQQPGKRGGAGYVLAGGENLLDFETERQKRGKS